MNSTDVSVDMTPTTSLSRSHATISTSTVRISSSKNPAITDGEGVQSHPESSASSSFRHVAHHMNPERVFSEATTSADENAGGGCVQKPSSGEKAAKTEKRGKQDASESTDGNLMNILAVGYMPPTPSSPSPTPLSSTRKPDQAKVGQESGDKSTSEISRADQPRTDTAQFSTHSIVKTVDISTSSTASIYKEFLAGNASDDISAPGSDEKSTHVSDRKPMMNGQSILGNDVRNTSTSPLKTTMGDLTLFKKMTRLTRRLSSPSKSGSHDKVAVHLKSAGKSDTETKSHSRNLTVPLSPKNNLLRDVPLPPLKEVSSLSSASASTTTGGSGSAVVPGTTLLNNDVHALLPTQSIDLPPGGTPLRLDAPGWQSTLASQAGTLRNGQRLSIRTEPASLGPIQIEATSVGKGGGIRIHLTANHADTVSMLQQASPLIAQQLMGGGLGIHTTVTASASEPFPSFSPFFDSSSQENDTSQNKDGHSFAHSRAQPLGSVSGVPLDEPDAPSSIHIAKGFESWI